MQRDEPGGMWRDWIVKSEALWSEAQPTLTHDERAGGALNRQIEEARQMQRMFAEMAQVGLAASRAAGAAAFVAGQRRRRMTAGCRCCTGNAHPNITPYDTFEPNG